jgi:hypothetical protein
MQMIRDILGHEIRLTDERLKHIESRVEMRNQQNKINETLSNPDCIFESNHDPEVLLYYRKYRSTPVTEKYLVVVAKVTSEDAFIVSSFFTDKIKSGVIKWQK